MKVLKRLSSDITIKQHYIGLPKTDDIVEILDKNEVVAVYKFTPYRQAKKENYSCDEFCGLMKIGMCEDVSCQLCFNNCFIKVGK